MPILIRILNLPTGYWIGNVLTHVISPCYLVMYHIRLFCKIKWANPNEQYFLCLSSSTILTLRNEFVTLANIDCLLCDVISFLLGRSPFLERHSVGQTRLGGGYRLISEGRQNCVPNRNENGKRRLQRPGVGGEQDRYLGGGIHGPGDAVWEAGLREAGLEDRLWGEPQGCRETEFSLM